MGAQRCRRRCGMRPERRGSCAGRGRSRVPRALEPGVLRLHRGRRRQRCFRVRHGVGGHRRAGPADRQGHQRRGHGQWGLLVPQARVQLRARGLGQRRHGALGAHPGAAAVGARAGAAGEPVRLESTTSTCAPSATAPSTGTGRAGRRRSTGWRCTASTCRWPSPAPSTPGQCCSRSWACSGTSSKTTSPGRPSSPGTAWATCSSGPAP